MSKPKKEKDPRGPDDETDDSAMNVRLIWIFLGISIVLLLAFQIAGPVLRAERPIPYSELKQKVRDGDVEKVLIRGRTVVATPTDEALEEARKEKSEDDSTAEFKAWSSFQVPGDEGLIPLLERKEIEYDAEPADDCSEGTPTLLLLFLPLLLLFLFFNWSRRMSMGGPPNPVMSFGKSKARLNMEEGTGVTFDDVAGCDEAKEELEEIIQFLKEPDRFTRLGGKVPKGVLLVGPPGTGKTLLARAVAGEADVPFFNLSGSDFVEMFVGVGAARVRDLFTQANENSPCIIFVDELDAIGKSRQGGGMQSNEEREQTLNALLVEMDGFEAKSGVIILAATNRPEVLDPALLRPGRFDRQVVVDRPDVRGRREILDVHARRIVMSDEVDLEAIAKQTPGFNGADLANVVNEAALLAARKEKDSVEMSDIQDAIERVVAGLEKKNRRLNQKEKDIVAYHESGHAIVTAALDETSTDEVHKVSIVSRGIGALGYTLQVPLEDRYLMTKTELYTKICGLLGGRAAEEIIFGDISTGASNDLQRVTDLARRIVINFGMSERLGNVNYGEGGGSFLGESGFRGRSYSEETAVGIDQEVHGLIAHLYQETLRILRENRSILEEMADYLKEEEVLEGEPLKEMLGRVLKTGQVAPFGTDGSISGHEHP